MTVIDYAEKIGVYKYLSNSQIDVLNEWQKAKDRGEEMLLTCCARGARTLLITITERYLGYMEGIADGRADAIEEVERAMYYQSFNVDHEEDGLQKWDSGNWVRYKLFENVIEQLKEKKISDK